MGKGDQKTRRGKIIRGSYGKRRSRKGNVYHAVVEAPKPVEEVKPEVKKEKKPAKPKAEKVKAEIEVTAEEKAE